MRLAAAGVALLASAAGTADGTDQAPGAFLDALVGSWEGRAVRTPRGPLPYDIRFERREDGSVAGVADPGAAEHHWTFRARDGGLRLLFLTTFGGNRDPIRLVADRGTDSGWIFRAEDPPYLRVEVSPGAERTDIRVRLHGEPHVRIRLERRDGSRSGPT